MPVVKRPGVLNAVYCETLGMIRAWGLPTQLITPDITLYRAVGIEYMTPTTRGIFPRQYANLCLVIRDQQHDSNRFSGSSLYAGIPSWGGLYCSLQQQALVNEVLHYKGIETRMDPATQRPEPVWIPRDPSTGLPLPDFGLNRSLIVKIRLMASALVADLSPHNPGVRQFVTELEQTESVKHALESSESLPRPLWEQLFDSDDCSVARGIGLAVASSGTLRGLQALTVRPSGRSVDETGDNVVWFGRNGKQVPGLWVEEAYVFPISGEMQVCPVEP